MEKLKKRILKAAFKRGNRLTLSELTRYVTRVALDKKQLAVSQLNKEGLLTIVTVKQLAKTGTNPTVYQLTEPAIEQLTTKKDK